MTRVVRVACIVALVATACGGGTKAPAVTSPTAGPGPASPVILDYSPTVSDVGALLFLATHPDVRLIGVTLPGTGESHCDPGVAHTRGVLTALGLGSVPVACGPDTAVGAAHPFPDDWRERSDTMELPEEAPNETRTAPDLIADLVAASSDPVRIVAVGPLTNLAVAFDEHPGIADKVAGITIMGGAVDVAGNVPPGIPGWESANSYAEVNFWVDPSAAARVVQSGVAVTLVPLDATNDVPTGRAFLAALSADPASTASSLLTRVWRQAPEWASDGYYLWDELAAAVAVDESIVTIEDRALVVDDGGVDTAGWSRPDPSGQSVRVAVSADRGAFEQLFLGTVRGQGAGDGSRAAGPDETAYFGEIAAILDRYDTELDALFEATATALGFDETTEDENAWAQVVVAAAPQAIDGPMAHLADELAAVPPPESVQDLHAEWVASLERVIAHRAEVLAAIDRFASGDETPLPYFDEVDTACAALQGAAFEAGVDVDLSCS